MCMFDVIENVVQHPVRLGCRRKPGQSEGSSVAVQAKPLAKQAPAAGEILRGEDRGAVFGLHMAQRASFDAAFEGRKPAKPKRAPKPGA
jgi:hypothetical protein